MTEADFDRYHWALRAIVATTDVHGHCHGHWHGVAVKLARAALFDFTPNLDKQDVDRIARNLPVAVPAAPPNPRTHTDA